VHSRQALRRVLVLVALLAVAAVAGAVAARAVVSDNGILNQIVAQDPVGDSAGADLSSFTVTSYADQTISFAATLANRDLLHPGRRCRSSST